MIFIKILILVGMFLITGVTLHYLQENGKEVQVGEMVTRRYLTSAACAAIAAITIAYDVFSVAFLMWL